MQLVKIKNEFPIKLKCLFEPATAEHGRYKVIHGGRAGIKSWSVARALLTRGVKKVRRNKLLPHEKGTDPISYRVWCAREIQESIEQSVYHLLVSQIKLMGYERFYVVEKTRIYGAPGTDAEGTEFFFKGLHFNVDERKSMEAVDVLWVDEANNVTKHAWDTIIPTIRKEYDDGTCSEIIITFNPELDTDETYARFIPLDKRPSNATVIETNWRDNKWLPQVIRVEIETLKKNNYDDYLTIYEGKTRQALEGAVFAKELRSAKIGGRICRFEVERGSPVWTFWDLGRADHTAIWFVQRVGLQWRFIDYYENNQNHIDHYIEVLDEKKYIYRTHFLPHDGKAKQLGSKRTIEEQLRGGDPDVSESLRDVRIVPMQSLTDQHNAARGIFPNCWFEEDKCRLGLSRLGRYRYDVDPETKQFSKKPLHDDNSHGASAFLQFAVAAREPERKRRPPPVISNGLANHAQGWMG